MQPWTTKAACKTNTCQCSHAAPGHEVKVMHPAQPHINVQAGRPWPSMAFYGLQPPVAGAAEERLDAGYMAASETAQLQLLTVVLLASLQACSNTHCR